MTLGATRTILLRSSGILGTNAADLLRCDIKNIFLHEVEAANLPSTYPVGHRRMPISEHRLARMWGTSSLASNTPGAFHKPDAQNQLQAVTYGEGTRTTHRGVRF
jgi:hypothetical protein